MFACASAVIAVTWWSPCSVGFIMSSSGRILGYPGLAGRTADRSAPSLELELLVTEVAFATLVGPDACQLHPLVPVAPSVSWTRMARHAANSSSLIVCGMP